ncbi:MAG: nucleotidyltransferase domain-containing protein [Nanoarchaeota archaeon]
MDWNKLKFTKLENDILEFLFRNPTSSFNGKEIADRLKVSQTAIAKSVKNLSKIGLVSVQKKILLSIKLNRENKITFTLKRIFNIKEIYSSGLLKALSAEFPGSAIVLFGSYSLGEDTEDSDIDIAIIGYKDKSIDLNIFERKIQRRVQLHFFKESGNIHKDLKENIINGITLEGAIKL